MLLQLSTKNQLMFLMQPFTLCDHYFTLYIYFIQPTPHIWGLLAGLVNKTKQKLIKEKKVNLIGLQKGRWFRQLTSALKVSNHNLKEIRDVFFKFLWDGNQDKVKRTDIINDFAKGGLKMLDLQSIQSRS